MMVIYRIWPILIRWGILPRRDMSLHEMKIRLPEHLWRRYKVVCVKRNLSISKQTVELVRVFVQNLEEEIKLKEKYGVF